MGKSMEQDYINSKYSKGLIISGLSIHLIYAIQLKCKMYPNHKMDLVIATSNQEIYLNKAALEKIFDNVYFLNMTNIEPPKNKSIKALINPKYALNEFYISDMNPDEYSDIFFWGPTWVYYNLFKYYVQKNKDYVWHLYGEGDSGYFEANPSIRLREYGYSCLRKFYKGIDKYFFKYTVNNYSVIKDIYLWSTQYVTYEPIRPIIEMPIVDREDKEFITLLNEIYGYTTERLENKIIIIDGAYMGKREEFYDVAIVDSMYTRLGKEFGKENVIIKPHHGVTEQMYSEDVINNCTIMTAKARWPWELALLNNAIKNCVICGTYSTAILMMYLIGITDTPTYLFRDMINMARPVMEGRLKIYDCVNEENQSFNFVSNNGDFEVMLNQIRDKYRD